MFPATVTRKLLGPRPGSPVKTGEINPSAKAVAWAKSLFPLSQVGKPNYSFFLFVFIFYSIRIMRVSRKKMSSVSLIEGFISFIIQN